MTMFEKHMKQLDEFLELTKVNPEGALVNSYQFIKEIAPYYYINGQMVWYYYKLLDKLTKHIEKHALKPENMLDFQYVFNTLESPSKEDILDYIIWCARNYLITDLGHFCGESLDLYEHYFSGDCGSGSKKIKEICNKLGIKCRLIKMLPGFSSKIIRNPWICNFHCFNIIELESKSYLVDITLAQFFCRQDNHPGRLGVVELVGPSVGYYMMRLNRGEELARKLLTDGYVLLDDELFKTYLDAFMLSFRNGLFYEENGITLPKNGIISPDDDIILPYTIDQYESFLDKSLLKLREDSQLKREGREFLGRQRIPLRHPDRPIFR